MEERKLSEIKLLEEKTCFPDYQISGKGIRKLIVCVYLPTCLRVGV